MDFVTLNNGVTMPQLGLGVYQIPDEEVTDVVLHAFKTGYRSVDTAQFYGNERGIGKAIKQSNIERQQLFITTKVWNSHQGFDKTLQAFEESMEKLSLDYLDLYLIHWPAPNFNLYIETYRALEKLYEDGKVKAIGVCNFNIEHLENLLAQTNIVPAVNQIECHPYFQQNEMKAFCKQHNIYVESWSPLYRADKIFQEETIESIANKYNKSPAQIIIRWHLQEESIVIPKSATPKRIDENFDVFDFQLTADEMAQLASLNRDHRRGANPLEMHLI